MLKGLNKQITFVILVSCVVVFFPMWADAGSVDTIGQLASRLTHSFTGIAKLITGGSYLAGGAFAVGAIMKFKQHKDNPTQIPIGAPIALLFISAALMFLPTVYKSAGISIFGAASASKIGTLTGTSTL